MADSDKDILITPQTGQTTDPSIVFSSGATGGDDVTLFVTDDGTITTLSVEGSSGQLFAITNDLTGIIFSVNDISGIPSIEVNADGTVSIAEFSGNVGIGTSSPSQKLHVEYDSATTNADIPVLRLTATSSGTPATGIGPSIEFESETAAGAPGNLEIGGVLAIEATDVTATSEDFDFVFSTMAAGAAAAERMRISSAGTVTATSFSGANVTSGADPGHTHTSASITSVAAANISAGNLGSGVLPYATASATASAFKVPFLNTTGTASGNFGLLHDTSANFTYNPSTDTLTVGPINAGAIDSTSTITASTYFKVDAANANGYGFWNGAPTTYGYFMSAAGTQGRIGGETTSDYNQYFEMNAGTNRGFVFETDGTKLFAVNPDGVRSAVALTVTGTMAATTVTGANVTSGANPGHTHTGTSISALDAGDTTTGVFDVARIRGTTHGVTAASALAEYNRFASAVDMDTLVEPGQYGGYAAMTNGPTGMTYDPIWIGASASDVTSQLVVPRTASRGLAYRGETSGVFTSWHYAGWTTTAANANMDSTYSPIAGSTSITTVGTVGTGTWQGTAVDELYGGTGQTTYATGDILYASASNTLSKLAAGTNTHVLTLSGGVPTWAAPTGGGISNVVEDTTPQLGGDLDLQTFGLTGALQGTGGISDATIYLTGQGTALSAGSYANWGRLYSNAAAFMACNAYADSTDTVGGQMRYAVSHASYGHAIYEMYSGTHFWYGDSANVTADAIVSKSKLMQLDHSGGGLTIYDAGGTDYFTLNHNGTIASMDFTNTTSFQFDGLTAYVEVMDGADIRVYDSDNSDGVYILHNGTSGSIGTLDSINNTDLNIVADASTRIICHGAIGTGETSGAQVVNHTGVSFYDIGFNTLPTFNFNASDTLEAQHSGHVTGKTNTSLYTLTGPTSSDLDFPVGGVCTVMNLGTSGNYLISDTTTCTMYMMEGDGTAPADIVGTCTLGPGGVATLYRYSTTAIYIWGSGLTL